MLCKTYATGWVRERFFIVDIPGPAIIGLPTCDKVHIVEINITVTNQDESKPPRQIISSLQDLKDRYPGQFDKIGHFKKPARLLLKEDTEPSIDAPRKCSIHLTDKLKKDGG